MTDAKRKRRLVPGTVERSFRLDEALYSRVVALAKRRRSPIRAVVEDALVNLLAAETADQTDQALAPEIDRVIMDRHKRLEAGLRSMIARVGYEMLRTQYIWLNFLTEAGIPPGKVDTWHEKGWQYAIKEFKRQPKADVIDDED